jgi:hypothetical protein
LRTNPAPKPRPRRLGGDDSVAKAVWRGRKQHAHEHLQAGNSAPRSVQSLSDGEGLVAGWLVGAGGAEVAAWLVGGGEVGREGLAGAGALEASVGGCGGPGISSGPAKGGSSGRTDAASCGESGTPLCRSAGVGAGTFGVR